MSPSLGSRQWHEGRRTTLKPLSLRRVLFGDSPALKKSFRPSIQEMEKWPDCNARFRFCSTRLNLTMATSPVAISLESLHTSVIATDSDTFHFVARKTESDHSIGFCPSGEAAATSLRFWLFTITSGHSFARPNSRVAVFPLTKRP
jgi:hypothetical protein